MFKQSVTVTVTVTVTGGLILRMEISVTVSLVYFLTINLYNSACATHIHTTT